MAKTPKKSEPITVRAKQPGLYGRYRDAGDVFQIADEQAFSELWMERVSGDEVETPAEPETTGQVDTGSNTSADVI